MTHIQSAVEAQLKRVAFYKRKKPFELNGYESDAIALAEALEALLLAQPKAWDADIFKGAEGLAKLAECQEFWDQQPYGTRLYFGTGISDYLHRDVLRAAVAFLNPPKAS